jgi:hypothetical protein
MNQLINQSFECVKYMSAKWKIDESHALKHSIEVYRFATNIYNSEVINNSFLKEQQHIINAAAILHDMCDKKYMNEQDGINDIRDFMKEYISDADMEVIFQIITTMSYSKVKQFGYPNLDQYMLAFHIVREADLLAAYDIDRCVIFGMMVDNMNYSEAVTRANILYTDRVLNYISDGLFVTQYSIDKSAELHLQYVSELYSNKKNN